MKPVHRAGFRSSFFAFLALSSLLLAIGCDAGQFVGPVQDRVLAPSFVGAADLTAEVGQAIGPLEVRLVDLDGAPVAGEVVEWAASSGTADPATSITDEAGAAATTWIVGAEGGEQNLVASAKGSRPLTVSARVASSPVKTITIDPDPIVLDTVAAAVQLQVSAVREDGTSVPPGHITYTSTDPEVVSVGSNGRVTALAVGAAGVIVSAGLLADTVAVDVPTPAPEEIELLAPTGLRVTDVGTATVSLDWEDAAQDGVVGYNVYQKSDDEEGPAFAKSATSSEATVNSLTGGRTYAFTVTAVDDAGNESPASDEVSATTEREPLPAPVGLQVTGVTESSISLAWEDAADARVTGYRVYRKTSSGGTARLAGTTSGSEITVDSLSAGTTYYFDLTAVDPDDNESPASEEVSAATESEPEPEPEPAAAPVVDIDFEDLSSTDELRTRTGTGGFSATEDVELNHISLDTNVAVNALGLTKSMRYDWRESDVGRSELTIGRSILLRDHGAEDARELWSEIYLKLSDNFDTRGVVDGKNPDWKAVFHRQYGGSGRAQYKLGTHPSQVISVSMLDPGMGQNAGYLAQLLDGRWHRIRFHTRMESSPGANDGVMRFWIDGKLVVDSRDQPTTDWSRFYGITIGANMNAGPPYPMQAWWGRIRVWTQDPGW